MVQALVAIGTMMGLQVFGVNIQPFLAIGGVSGLVVGLAAQSVVANLISGINLVGVHREEDQSCFGIEAMK